jgi:hypothetical protein
MKLTLLISVAVIFSSCAYQYFNISANHLAKNENNDFVVENDPLKVTYRFNGDNAPVKITLLNKTDEPLEIDWKRSALIMNGQATSYYSPNLYVNGSVQQGTSRHYIFGDGSFLATVNADIYVNEPSQFIPPKSSISKIPLILPVHSLELPSDQLKKATHNSGNQYNIKYKKIEHSSQESPFSFRSYLSFHYAGDPNKTFSLDHHFYVSEIWQTGNYPTDFPEELLNRGDFLY